MTPKQKYREFLKTPFWKALSAQKRELVRKCEKCGGRVRLQSHHRFYREDWFDTRLEDLEVLCRFCHRESHGMDKDFRFINHRPEKGFNQVIHRIGQLIRMVKGRRPLRDRDRAFLEKALKLFPPNQKDSCVSFQVGLVLRFNGMLERGEF